MKKLELLMERCYAWLIYCLPSAAVISLLIWIINFVVGGLNLPSLFAVFCFLVAHDSIYCWRHGRRIFSTLEPSWMFVKRLISEKYYENYHLTVGVVATIIGVVSFGVSAVIFILNLLSL